MQKCTFRKEYLTSASQILITRDENNFTWKQLTRSSDSPQLGFFEDAYRDDLKATKSYVAKPRKGHVFRTRVFSSRLSMGLSMGGIVSWTDCKYRTVFCASLV